MNGVADAIGQRLSHASALTRMRWVFLAMIALSNLWQLPIALAVPSVGEPAMLVAGVALVWLKVSAFWLARRRQPHPALDLADCCALVMLALQANYAVVVAAAFPVIFFTSTYGTPRRLIFRTAGFLVAFVAAVTLCGDADPRLLPGYLITMVSLTGVLHLLTASINRNERSLAYERTLASAGTRLLTAQTREDVYLAAIESAHKLVENDPLISAAVLLPSGQDLVVAAARGLHAELLTERRFPGSAIDFSLPCVRVKASLNLFTEVLVAPLSIAGEVIGALALASPSRVPTDLEETVLALAAETALALETLSSRERFRSLVQHSSDVFTIVSTDGTISYQSPSFGKLTGISPDVTIGQPVTAFLHAEDAAKLASELENRSTSTLQLELRWRHVDGQWRHTEAIISDLLDDPNVKGWTFNTRDVSERARLETELRHAQKLESVGRLAAGMAHEINTPIQFIGDNLHFLKSSVDEVVRKSAAPDLDPDAAADLTMLEHEIPLAIDQSLEGVRRVAAIVRSLREFAQPQAREQVSANLNQALLNTLTVAGSEVRDVADVVTDLVADLPPVRCYLSELNQVFLSVVINAAHAVADAGRTESGVISVVSRRDGDDVVISITDDGCGIEESIRGYIFDPFFTTKPIGRGTGQGLAIARSIVVDKHHGALDFTSSVGQGTTFVIRLPIAGAAETSDTMAA